MSKSVTVPCACCNTCPPEPNCSNGTSAVVVGTDENDCNIYQCCADPPSCPYGEPQQSGTDSSGCPTYICCPDPSPCGFVDPDGDPCQLFDTRVTTITQYASDSFSYSCEDEDNYTGFSGSGSRGMNATITTTETCQSGSVVSTTEQYGSSYASASYYTCEENPTLVFSGSCSSTLTNDGWSGSVTTTFGDQTDTTPTYEPCVNPTETNTVVTYSNPIDRCCDGYAPVGPFCECVYVGG